jgi:hypothetical protein
MNAAIIGKHLADAEEGLRMVTGWGAGPAVGLIRDATLHLLQALRELLPEEFRPELCPAQAERAWTNVGVGNKTLVEIVSNSQEMLLVGGEWVVPIGVPLRFRARGADTYVPQRGSTFWELRRADGTEIHKVGLVVEIVLNQPGRYALRVGSAPVISTEGTWDVVHMVVRPMGLHAIKETP